MSRHDVVAQVAVVLGAAVWPGGVPSTSLRRRVEHAAALIHEGVAEHLLLTGGVGKYPPAEAEVMRVIANQRGVPASRIVLEPLSRNTLDSAARCAAIISARGWRRVLVVTDRYHVPRALLAFRAHGIKAQGSPPSGGLTSREYRFYLYLREGVAVPYYLLRVALARMRRSAVPQ